jgi:hypothetical protein
MSEPKLGDTVRCKVTGFTGVMTVISTYITGCSRGGVQPPITPDGKLPDAMYFDIPMLEVVQAGTVKPVPTKQGGPREAPKQQSAPR